MTEKLQRMKKKQEEHRHINLFMQANCLHSRREILNPNVEGFEYLNRKGETGEFKKHIETRGLSSFKPNQE